MPFPSRDQQVRFETERWFHWRGLAIFIDDDSVAEDVLTRVVPFMALAVLIDAFQAFGRRILRSS